MSNPQIGQLLSHYRLVEKIGEGGMGVVWKAVDTVLGRTVAIKVLPAGLASDEQRREMFLNEARLAASVSEAHIVQVHEFGREGDVDFIVMEHVEGKPLSAILHGRPLPPEKVASLGLQAARALSSAHGRGLLHRDLKPANLLVTSDGDLKVVDFGLAILFERRAPGIGADDPTCVGEAESGAGSKRMPLAGTLPYMSPEQARSESLDARSDIFSLGVVLYEMTTGQRPFTGATHAELLREILRARPQPMHVLVPKVPLELDRIVQKSLAPQAADRYQTMEDLAVDLKRLARDLEAGSSPSYDDLKEAPTARKRPRVGVVLLAGTLFLATVAAGVWLTRWRPGARVAASALLILPMEVRGQIEGADYVGRAFAEAIAVNLSQVKGLDVLPVPEVGELGRGGALARAGDALKAGAGRMLTGSLTRDGQVVHANLSLVDTRRNFLVSGFQKDGSGESLTTLAISMAGEVAAALGRRPPKSYEYFLYLSGTPAMSASPDFGEALGALRRLDIPAALRATRRLVDAFPNEPDAHVLRAVAAFNDALEPGPGSPQWQSLDETLISLERADPRSPWCEYFRAYSIAAQGRATEAIERFTQVLARDDLTPAARAYILGVRGYWRASSGQASAAIADAEEATRLNPTDDRNLAIVSATLRELGHLEEAQVRARQAVALNPASGQNYLLLGNCLYRMGRWEESIAPLARACALRPIQSYCASQAPALLRAGRLKEAQAAAATAASLPESDWGAYVLARYHLLAGDRGGALRLLGRFLELSPGLAPTEAEEIMHDPDLAAFKADPKFRAILAEVERRARRE